ncbi:hypothetical protein H4R99_003888 [Coemansia sp. RSA 1722]|nr:hypothetical protein H4R99_003888 [Coemansia sp. RSA 1722]
MVSYISDKDVLNIVVRGQRLGNGWTGKSAELGNSLAEIFEPSGSLFRFQLPTILEEWSLDFSLVFDPQYTVPGFVSLPVLRPINTIHIDALDSLQPCSDQDHAAQAQLDAVAAIPHLCEVWVKPESMNTSELSDLAPKLLLALLFEKISPLKAHQIMSAVMISPTAAEFRIPSVSGNPGYVNIMCICEHGRLALRLCSAIKDVYLGVLVAIIKRLCLLLDQDLDLDLQETPDKTSSDISAVLDMRTQDLVRVLQATENGQFSSINNESSSSTYADFIFIECKTQRHSALFQ